MTVPPGPPFAEIDRHLAGLLVRMAAAAGQPDTSGALASATAWTSLLSREGHACLELAADDASISGARGPTAAERSSWLGHLRRFPSVVGTPGEAKPLILDTGGRLYLHRLHTAETEVADRFRRLAAAHGPRAADGFDEQESLARLFPDETDGEIPWQRMAAFAAARHGLTVVCGGPGTGKTRTIAQIAAFLIEQGGEARPRIALAAPTGKAAARLRESILSALPTLPCRAEIRDRIPRETATIHRLLGASADGTRFRHGPANPLEADVVVVDEASMVDLPLMSRLVSAMAPGNRLILVGDPDQLPSVESGGVLADLRLAVGPRPFSRGLAAAWSAAGNPALPEALVAEKPATLADRVITLRKTHRHAGAMEISRLAAQVREGDPLAVSAALWAGVGDVRFRQVPVPHGLVEALRPSVLAAWNGGRDLADIKEATRRISAFRILCAVRDGPWGVTAINRAVIQILGRTGPSATDGWFAGLQIMITANDHSLRLYNGDLGIVRRGTDGPEVVFPASGDGVRSLPAGRLPPHEAAFAITIHKSQGSEFGRVLLILPPAHRVDADGTSPVGMPTRELVYTAITRARHGVEIWGETGVLARAVAAQVRRASALAARLG